MPRLRQVSRADADERTVRPVYDLLFGDRDPVAEPGTDTGTPGDWWTTFALVPDVFDHCVRGFGLYRSPKRLLDPLLAVHGRRARAEAFSGNIGTIRVPFGRHLPAVASQPAVPRARRPGLSASDSGC